MISIIAVVGKNRAIGYRNKLLWNLPRDMKRFKKITTGHPIIMGEQTFKSIGRPLPNRRNIVLSRDEGFQAPRCEVERSLENVLKIAKEKKTEFFIIGGGQIYEQSLPWADKLYLTIINDEPNADTFFPDYSDFKKVVFSETGVDNGYRYKFLELVRQ